ncbi:MAG: endonuclease III [Candidatus Thermoplasmatota archaeon]|nr:endonuclease III [Candidatus Thermoplasmatota archaeon]
MDEKTSRRALSTVLRRYPAQDWTQRRDPFEVLVSVVISQNTTVQNERRALQNLRDSVGITPERVAATGVENLERALRPAGLYTAKAKWLKALAQHLLDRYQGDLLRLIRPPLEQARAALMALNGIGPKTADVVLAMVGDYPTMPVDTHIWRIAQRWEIDPGRRYEDITEAWKARIPPEQRREAHLALIRFGRETCTARLPRCLVCPVGPDCPFYEKIRTGQIQARIWRPSATAV